MSWSEAHYGVYSVITTCLWCWHIHIRWHHKSFQLHWMHIQTKNLSILIQEFGDEKNNSQNFWNFSAKKYFFQQFIDWFRVWILTRQKYGNTDFIHCTSKLHNKHAFSWTHRLWVCVCVRVHVYSYIGVYTFFLTRCIADTRSKWYSTGVQ